MKSDIDALMQEQNIDALLITGQGAHNPFLYYFTGGGLFTHADVIKLRGADPVLLVNPMERDEAARTGLRVADSSVYSLQSLLKETNGDSTCARALRYQRLLADLGFQSGRLAVYGQTDAGLAHAVLSQLEKLVPGLEIVDDSNQPLILQAMATKDSAEVERIRDVGKKTVEVVAQVADFLTSQRVVDEVLVGVDGAPLTIGDVKRKINLWLAERDLENPEGTIFAIGADAGVPHSSGQSGDLLRLGSTIVFDIFPCEAGGGYFYDFTRTWCLGYAPDFALSLYVDVRAVYNQVVSDLRPGAECKTYQVQTCELFEARGHATIGSNLHTTKGYVHSLGHGVGLRVHESPSFSQFVPVPDILKPGMVFTIEPGLYYPERGAGVRLEDTFWMRPDGSVDALVYYPMDLVLPVK